MKLLPGIAILVLVGTAGASLAAQDAAGCHDASAAPAAASAPPPRSWQEVNHAAKVAHDARDYALYRSEVGQLDQLLSGNPEIVMAAAKAEALLGHPAAALDWLHVYAAMGLVRDLAAEPELASLRQQPGYAAVQARLDANRQPATHAAVAFTLRDPGLLAEDLAYDPATRRYFVSSVRQARILAVDANSGAATDFVPAGRDAIWGILALAVDAPRGILWATTAAMPQTLTYRPADLGHTAVLRYDLATGKLVRRYDLPVAPPPPTPPAPAAATGAAATVAPAAPAEPAEDRSRVLGDMTVAPGGDVFVSEAVTGAVYTIRPGGAQLEVLVPPGTFVSPQNPAVAADARRLFVADYLRGIGVVDLTTRQVTWMSHPPEVAVSGIDGMYLAGDSLIAVQNGTEPNRVVRFRLDPTQTRILRWEPLDSSSPGLGVPTHGVVVGRDFFFIANSGWDRLADDGTQKPDAHPTPSQVRRVPL